MLDISICEHIPDIRPQVVTKSIKQSSSAFCFFWNLQIVGICHVL